MESQIPKTLAPNPEGEVGVIEKIFEEERGRGRLEYRVYAEFNDNDIAERIDITVTWYPLRQYGNHVSLSMALYLGDGLSLEVRKWRDSWGGSGLDFKNIVTIYTTQELDDMPVLGKDRYMKINSVGDVKELISDILGLFEDFVTYYIKSTVEEFIGEVE